MLSSLGNIHSLTPLRVLKSEGEKKKAVHIDLDDTFFLRIMMTLCHFYHKVEFELTNSCL